MRSLRTTLLAMLLLPTTLAAQTRVRRPTVPTANLGYKNGCPSSLAPASNNAVASATDYVELERTGCAGQTQCPVYRVRISGDGIVNWFGIDLVETKGPASATIDTIEARALMQRIADRNFFNLCTQYGTGSAVNATYKTTLSMSGMTRKIDDYAGTAPSYLRELDRDIDRTADTHRWRHGDPQVETFAGDHLSVDAREPKAGVTRFMRLAAIPESLPDLRQAVQDTAANLNERDSAGWTPLMYAAQSGTLEAMRLLLQNGADPRLISNAGETAMSAAVSAYTDADQRVQVLHKSGLPVGERDRRGVSPLMLACRYGSNKDSLIRTLLALGADPQQRDVDGKTALDYLKLDDPALRALLEVKKVLKP